MDITFIVNLYKEPKELVWKLDYDLKRFYPDSKILYLSDGPDAVAFGEHRFSFDERLKVPGHSNRWVHRYLETYLKNSNTTHCVKIDPDASVVDKMIDTNFGDVFVTKVFLPFVNLYIPHAGVIGFSREYVKKVVDEKLCLHPKYAVAKVHGTREELIFTNLFRETKANVIDRMDFCCGPKREQDCIGQYVSFRHK